jgi:hypothetical protein
LGSALGRWQAIRFAITAKPSAASLGSAAQPIGADVHASLADDDIADRQRWQATAVIDRCDAGNLPVGRAVVVSEHLFEVVSLNSQAVMVHAHEGSRHHAVGQGIAAAQAVAQFAYTLLSG